MNRWSRRGEREAAQSPLSARDDQGDPSQSTYPDAWLLDVQTPWPTTQQIVPPSRPLAPPWPRAALDGRDSSAPLLEVRDMTVSYGQISAVRHLSLMVGAGELVALLGANGAGKTTTLRAISGLHRPRAGRVYFEGQRIDRLSAEQIARKGIAHLPEGRGLFPRLTVDENFRMAAYGAGVPAEAYQAQLAAALDFFPILHERMGQLAGTLSGGQQQMLAVARALVTRPRLLMIDELSFGLAPVVVKQLFALLPGILAGGTAILLVEQFVGQALSAATRAYVLEKGELSYAGSASELAEREGFVESSYLGSNARRPSYQRMRSEETEMLRVRVEPSMIRRLRAVGGGRPIHEMANEAIKRYLATHEAANTSVGSRTSLASQAVDDTATEDQIGGAL